MKKLYIYLAYAGTLPFIFGAMCLVVDIHTIPLLGDTNQVLSLYALVIASFMAGSHWGLHLKLENKWRIYLPVFSNIVAILLWLSVLVLPDRYLFIDLVVIFLALLIVDMKLFQAKLINREYFRNRCLVTSIVVLALIISWIYL